MGAQRGRDATRPPTGILPSCGPLDPYRPQGALHAQWLLSRADRRGRGPPTS
jgi:hypothetical protein